MLSGVKHAAGPHRTLVGFRPRYLFFAIALSFLLFGYRLVVCLFVCCFFLSFFVLQEECGKGAKQVVEKALENKDERKGKK